MIGLILLFRLTPLRTFTSLDTIIAWVASAQANPLVRWGFFLIFPIVILGVPIAIFPVIGGILFPFWIAFPMNMAAILLGATIAFWIGRILGRDMVTSILGRKARGFRQFRAEQGFRTVLLIRWIGLPPFLITNYAFGFTGFRFDHYIAGTALGVLPWTAITTFLASALWEAVIAGKHGGFRAAAQHFLGAPFWAFAGFVLVVFLVHRVVRPKSPAPEREPEI